MLKKLFIPVLLLSSLAPVTPVKAGFTDGLVVGGFVGLTSALIGSAIANNSCRRDVVVYEQPVVYYEEPCIVYEPTVVYEPIVYKKPCPRKQRACKKKYATTCEALPKKQKEEIVKKTIVETQVISPKTNQAEIEKQAREMVIKERQIELDLVKEKKELLREENRKKELALREREIENKVAKV